MIKIIITFIFSIISIIINYLLLYKIDKKLFKVSLILIIIINLLLYFIDFYIINNDTSDYLAFNLLLSFLLSITFEDIKTNLMDTRVILFYFILFTIYRIVFLDLAIFLEGFIGFALSGIILLIAYFIRRNSIGVGDIEAIATCGMIIGYPNIFHFLFKTFLFVLIYGLFLIFTKKKNVNNEIPLAPFLLLATII